LLVIAGFSFFDRVSPCSPGYPGIHALLPHPPKCWYYRHAPPHLTRVPLLFKNLKKKKKTKRDIEGF
jgi:hypothetical protein